MTVSRRQFVATSSLSVAALGMARLPVFAHTGAQSGAQSGAQTAAQTAAAQAPPVTKFEEIRRGVGYFTGTGGTIGYLVNGDGAIVIDSQFLPTAEICVAGLKQRAPKGIELLINTHHHGDHTSGNAAFKPVAKRILAHENCVAWQRKVAEQAAANPQPGAAAPAPPVYADATFKDTWTVAFGGENVHVHYFGPAHTSGDAVILFEKANVIHAGDLLFRRLHPRVDSPAGASVVNWLSMLEKMAAAHGGDTAFIFGHGKDGLVLGKVDDVKFFRDYLSAALDHVRAGIKSGQSKDEVAKATALKGFEDVTPVNARITLAGVLESAYDELAKK